MTHDHSQFSAMQRASMMGSRVNPFAFGARQKNPAAEAQVEADLDRMQRMVDIIGVLDQSGAADLSNAVTSLIRAVREPQQRSTHLRNAAMSAIGAIPFFGSVGLLGKEYKAATAAAKAKQPMQSAANAANMGRAARFTRAGGQFARQNPGVVLTVAQGIFQIAKSFVGRKSSDPESDTSARYEQVASAAGNTFRNVASQRGSVDGLRDVVGGSWDWMASRSAGRGRERVSGGGGTAPLDYGTSQNYATNFAAREYPAPSRQRSWARRIGGGLLSAGTWTGRALYDETPLAWAGGAAQAIGGTAIAAGNFGPRTLASNARSGARFMARTGAFGPLAAHAAGGWYGNPSNVAATIKSFTEGLLKATAAVITWTAGLRLANAGVLAVQQRYAPYGGTMATALSRFQSDEIRRNIRMANTIGASYAGLSAAQSGLEDRTLPYRALATNIGNRLAQGTTKITNTGIDVIEALAERLTGVTDAVTKLNDLLGGTTGDIPPYQSLMHDIAKGKFASAPTVRPR